MSPPIGDALQSPVVHLGPPLTRAQSHHPYIGLDAGAHQPLAEQADEHGDSDGAEGEDERAKSRSRWRAGLSVPVAARGWPVANLMNLTRAGSAVGLGQVL